MDILFAQEVGGFGGVLSAIVPFLLMFLIMYFILIRPQRKQQKQFDEMIATLKKGDKILTRGGIYCIIIDFVGEDKNKIFVEAGGNIKFHISRSYVATLIDKEKTK